MSIKRFKSRYGRRVKKKFGAIEKTQRSKHKCEYCNKVSVKRISAGIWECRACNKKFTGRAYTL